MTLPRFAIAAVAAGLATLSACGGDVGDARVRHGTTPVTSAAAGLYVGYYQEDTTNDPADPVAGAFVLNLPAASGAAFTGSIDYNNQPCQTANALPLAGTRGDLSVTGTFAGTVDAVARSGSFSVTLDTTALNFGGTYAVDSGKVAVAATGSCAAYTLAGLGKVELFPVGTNYPSNDFVASYTPGTRTVSWSTITAASKALVYLVDATIATSSTSTANPVPWQTLIDPATSTLSVAVPSTVTLVTGRQYYAVVEIANASRTRVAFSSASFTAP